MPLDRVKFIHLERVFLGYFGLPHLKMVEQKKKREKFDKRISHFSEGLLVREDEKLAKSVKWRRLKFNSPSW